MAIPQLRLEFRPPEQLGEKRDPEAIRMFGASEFEWPHTDAQSPSLLRLGIPHQTYRLAPISPTEAWRSIFASDERGPVQVIGINTGILPPQLISEVTNMSLVYWDGGEGYTSMISGDTDMSTMESDQTFDSDSTVSSIFEFLTGGLVTIAEKYECRDLDGVVGFLLTHLNLIHLLLEAHPQIEKYFPESSKFLERVTDPEAEGHGELILSVLSKYEPREAVERLKQFDDGWWSVKFPEAVNRLCITLEFA